MIRRNLSMTLEKFYELGEDWLSAEEEVIGREL